MGRTGQAASGTSPMHLVHSEINAVTSAIRKHARNTASSSFLGSASAATAGIGGPVAGGSSTASLLKSAVVAASIGYAPVSSTRGPKATAFAEAPGGKPSENGRSEQGLRVAHGRNRSFDNAATALSPSSPTFTVLQNDQQEPMSLRYVYADARRDDSVVSLLNAFTVLRAQLHESGSIDVIPPPLLTLPFLRVILSPRTTGPVTSIALQSVYRLLVYGIVKTKPPRGEESNDLEVIASRQDGRDSARYLHKSASQLAVAEIAHAVSHCRFEASDPVADELVLLRILAVMRELICPDSHHSASASSQQSTLADCLSDESICEMMETGLSMCCQMRLSDLLRKTAEQSMTTMIRALFSRLEHTSLLADEAYATDSNGQDIEPDHATLAADHAGEDPTDTDSKSIRRMTMPDPKSSSVPAAGSLSPAAMQELKSIGEHEEQQESRHFESADENANGKAAAVEERGDESLRLEIPSQQAEEETDATQPSNTKSAEDFVRVDVRPYGLPAIKEVLRVIISLLDPHAQQHTDAMRLLGLSILGAVFEVAGQYIQRFPSLRALVQDSACKHLFMLSRSDNAMLLSFSLRTMSAMFETMRENLKLQYEFFLLYLLDRLAPTFPISSEPWKEDGTSMMAVRRANLGDSKEAGAGTPDLGAGGSAPPPPPPPPPLPRSSDRSPTHGETREQTIETLSMLLGLHLPHRDGIDPFVELWINYDCDIDCENLFEKAIHFLCRSVYAANPLHPHAQESTQLFAIDAILRFVSQMAARQEAESGGFDNQSQWPRGLPSTATLASQKERKATILTGAAKFNEKPKEGLKFFEQVGFIEPTGSPKRDESIARFLKECPGLDKKLLGDYLSRPENEGVLGAYLRLFDFQDTPIAEAMRDMLEAFRLPGESQQIARITETFASIYFATKPVGIRSEDAVYILSYSIIMLNTDQHNPQNRTRMTMQDYTKNLRGVNDGADFDQDFLSAIYDSIRRREIVMPEEHKGQLGFEYQWKELLRRSRKAGDLLCVPTTHFDEAIFRACWRPVVASIAHAFSTYRDEHLLERAIIGFRQCAVLASQFGMYELFDFMIEGLASATGLLDANGVGQVTNNAAIDFEGQRITISPLSVQFGRNFKGQLAAVVLFTIANGNGHAVRKGWLSIFEICKNLFINSLLSPQLGFMFEFGSSAETEQRQLPIRAKRAPGPSPQDPRSQSGAGIFSTISSYLLSPYSQEKESARPDIAVNEESVESSLCTVDCLASCRIEELFVEMSRLNAEVRKEALEALRQLADRYTVERRSSMLAESHGGNGNDSSGRSTPVQSSTPGNHSASLLRYNQPLPYDPSNAFVLEIATNLVSSSLSADATTLWTIVSDHAVALISAPGQYHSLQVERAVVSLLRLIAYTSIHTADRERMFVALDRINGLPTEYRTIVAPQVTAGLHAILSSNPTFATSKTEWSVILTMLAVFGNARSANAVRYALAALQAVVIRQEDAEQATLSGAEPVSGITLDNFAGIVTILRDFARSADTMRFDAAQNSFEASQARKTLTEKKAMKEFEDACQERGPIAVQALESLKVHVPRLATEMGAASIVQVWQTLWLPLMSAIALQYTNGHRPTRQAALTHLQRILLASEIFAFQSADRSAAAEEERVVLHAIFNIILFPTLHELLKPEVFQLDPSNEVGSMQETRIRACNLLCKVYLHYLGQLTMPSAVHTEMSSGQAQQDVRLDENFLRLWLTILDFFDRFMHSGKRDQLTEATPENLKNVLLVMNAAGLLLPPPSASMKSSDGGTDLRTPEQKQLFDETFARIERFLPSLREDIFPTPSAAPPQPVAPVPALAPAPAIETATSADVTVDDGMTQQAPQVIDADINDAQTIPQQQMQVPESADEVQSQQAQSEV